MEKNVDAAFISKTMWIADRGDGTYQNPVLYADYSDPDVIRVGEDYYMISSSFCNAPAIPLLHSKDLVNWKVINYVCDSIPESRYVDPIHGCGVWAPSIRYHEGTFYVCFPMPDEGIYMTTATDPYGKWTEPVNIRPGAGWIDPCPFWDEDGKAYLVAGVAKSRIGYKSVLHMVEMQPDGMGLIGKEVKVFDGNLNDQITIEGPKLYKRNGWYYIFAPAGGVKVGWQTVLRSQNIWGPYEYRVVMRQGSSDVNGPHQGAWVDTVTGEDWFLHFQDVYAAGRIIHLQPMIWENDWPVIGINPQDNPAPQFEDAAQDAGKFGEPVRTYKKPNVGQNDQNIYEPATSDEFQQTSLGLQWQWNANYQQDWYCCTSQGLQLNAVPTETGRELCNVRNLLLQKWPAPEFTCVTKLDISGLADGDEAGIVSLGMRYAGIGFRKTNQSAGTAYDIVVTEGSMKFNGQTPLVTEESKTIKTVSAKEIQNGEIWFRYVLKRTGTKALSEEENNVPVEQVEMSYSIDGSNFVSCVVMEPSAGRWVGVKNGIYCIHRADTAKDRADSHNAGSTDNAGARGSCLAKFVRYFR